MKKTISILLFTVIILLFVCGLSTSVCAAVETSPPEIAVTVYDTSELAPTAQISSNQNSQPETAITTTTAETTPETTTETTKSLDDLGHEEVNEDYVGNVLSGTFNFMNKMWSWVGNAIKQFGSGNGIWGIPFYEAYDNGLFLTGPDTYTLIFAFENLDYTLLRDVEQVETYERYQRLLNALPTDIGYQEFIMNSDVNKNKLSDVLIPQDELYSKEIYDDYCSIIKQNIKKSEIASSEKIMLIAMSYKPSNNIDNVNVLFKYYRELQTFFTSLQSETRQLFPQDVFRILFEFYHPFDNLEFLLPKNIYLKGGSIKDYIAPSMFTFKAKEIEIGNSFTRVMYMKHYDRELDDKFIKDLLENNYKITISKQVQHLDKSDALDRVKNAITDTQGQIQKRKENNHKSGTDFIPFRLIEKTEELEDLQDRLSGSATELFQVAIFIAISAQTIDELEELTFGLQAKAKKHQIVLDVFVRQQEKALNSVLPFGINHFNTKNGNNVNTNMLSDAAGVLLPFTTRTYFSETGISYGLNSNTNAMIVLDRTDEMNSNGFVLATSGAGKSMFTKSEIIDIKMKYPNDEVIVIDPENEYFPLVSKYDGEILNLSADSATKLNIFDTDLDYGEDGMGAISLKSEFIMTVVETARGLSISSAEKSLIDRCVKDVYKDFILHNGDKEYLPTLTDFYNHLLKQPEDEAKRIAIDLELYVTGSFNTFADKTNIKINKKFLVMDISNMGEQLRTVGLQIILEFIWQRVIENSKKGIRTWLWVDEFSIMYIDVSGNDTHRSGLFFQKVFKRIRKHGGVATGITQNITEVLQSPTARIMFANSEFVVLLQQKKQDLDQIVDVFDLSPSQANYLKTGIKGTGLIVCGKKVIPFERIIPKNTIMYDICNTDFKEKQKKILSQDNCATPSTINQTEKVVMGGAPA